MSVERPDARGPVREKMRHRTTIGSGAERRVPPSPFEAGDPGAWRRRFEESRREIQRMEEQNAQLAATLEDARQNIQLLQDEIDSLSYPPNSYAIFLRENKDGTAEILMDGRHLRVGLARREGEPIEEGQLVRLNESLVVIEAAGYPTRGEVVNVVEAIDDHRVLVGSGDDERVVTLAASLRAENVRVGDHLLIDPKAQYAFERMPRSSVQEVVLEEVPDVTYDQIGGMAEQIEALRDSLELPYLHPEIFEDHQLKPPKGILLYGPPGCGKTLVAKAVANSLATRIGERTGRETTAYFLNVKGPELLDKYVGETEHKLREVFRKAREKASQDVPVVVFFDEMDSLFRTRGSGISSDMEATVVAQFLAEIDGVESLENVIVMGASNRQDLIDPAVLRPGRLDLKVKVARPDREAAGEIFSKYLTRDLPLHESVLSEYGGDADVACRGMIEVLCDHMYATGDENRFLEITYAKGEREILYFKDFVSGAMIASIVDRAKRKAVKRMLDQGARGIRLGDLLDALRDEFRESEDLPNTTNPDDWARISGRKGERIASVRTLFAGDVREERETRQVADQGQYL